MEADELTNAELIERINQINLRAELSPIEIDMLSELLARFTQLTTTNSAIPYIGCSPGYKWIAINLELLEKFVQTISEKESYNAATWGRKISKDELVAGYREEIGYSLSEIKSK